MRNPNCTRCGKKLSKPRLAANKRKCYLCEVAVRREGKQRAHDRRIESEDFTASDYWLLYKMQEGRCAIHSCRASGKSKFLAVEHDHSCEMGHDKNRWCRVCVRGLTCSTHNEWIGRAGDNPDVFDSLAAYLRTPPARETLMERMVAGTLEETLATLHNEYRIPWQRAKKMTDLARGVGPKPTHLRDCTIVIKYVRIPRSSQVLYAITEYSPWADRKMAVKILVDEYKFKEVRAKALLNSAWEKGNTRIKKASKIIYITYQGRGLEQEYMFSIEEGQ